MCGRFTLATPVPELARIFRAERLDDSVREEGGGGRPRYNIAPTEPIVVLRRAEGDGPCELARLRWGLIPEWVEDPGDWPLLINARAESLEEKPAFRDAVRSRRCLVLADGFYEWRAEEGGKQPYYVRLRSGDPIAFAGLWERAAGPQGPIDSCAIVTTDANDLLRPIHDRMPVILAPDARERWLDPAVRTFAELEGALRPPGSEALVVHPVSRRVNTTAHDDPSLIEPLEETARIAWGDEETARGDDRTGGANSGTAGGDEEAAPGAGGREGPAGSPQLELI